MLLSVKYLALPLLLFTLAGCGDNAQVTIYDRSILDHPPTCLKLDIFPPDPNFEKSMRALYPFSSTCPYHLSISTKCGIHCNSNANAPQKTLSNFPSAYLRLDLRKGMKLLYSYYRDLTSPADTDDLKSAFLRLKKDLRLQ